MNLRGRNAATAAMAAGLVLAATGSAVAQDGVLETPAPMINGADTAWMLACCGLVLLMTPGLALFYGGLVRTKNVLGTMMHSMICMGIVTVQWVLIGFSIAFGTSDNGICGGSDYFLLKGLAWDAPWQTYTIPGPLFMAFQMMFAIITPALISGAFAERVKFLPFCAFVILWSSLVYDPIAHWVWGGGILSADPDKSWVFKWFGTGALDFAGGTVVHISSGVSALVFALLIGRRRGYPAQPMKPNNLALSVLGAGLLWFGWFGFNGGSGLAANAVAANALVVTHVCAAVAALSWSLVEYLHHRQVTMLGVITGLVAGLVCITPASGSVDVLSSMILGLIVGPVCYLFVAIIKGRLGYDDSLDAFGVHGIGGITGALLTGLFFRHEIAGVPESVSIGNQFGAQAVATLVTVVYAAVVTAVLVVLLDKTVGLRVKEEDELSGLDLSQHGESGYNFLS